MSDIITDKNGENVVLDIPTISASPESQEPKENNKTKESKHKENGITIDKLIDGYLKRTSVKIREEYLKVVIKVKPYVGYGTKIFLADTIIKTSCLNDGQIYIDSCKKYLLYIYTLIDTYTNIELNQKDLMIQYDRLDSIGLIEPILALIPEKERATFKTILDMKQDDLMTNRYGVHAFIKEQMDRLTNVFSEFSKAFSPLVEKLNDKIETLDENKIEKILNKTMKLIK